MPYIPPEVVEQARQIDLLTYLQNCEPHELVRIAGNNYTTRTHDSLKISNGKWMWWSQRIGGYNALDYLVKVKGVSFVEAVETLMGKAAVMPTLTVRPKQEEKPKILLLPEKSSGSTCLAEGLTQPLPTNVSKKALSLRACLTIISFSSALMKSRNRNTPLSGRPTAAAFWATAPAAISTILFG